MPIGMEYLTLIKGKRKMDFTDYEYEREEEEKIDSSYKQYLKDWDTAIKINTNFDNVSKLVLNDFEVFDCEYFEANEIEVIESQGYNFNED